MKKLERKDILQMHELLANETGGARGLKDEGLLDSALNAPFQTFAGKDLYEGLIGKAAKLGHGIINNHPFVDGNKRIGLLTMLAFLEINGLIIEITNLELVTLTIKLADGSISTEALENILRSKKGV